MVHGTSQLELDITDPKQLPAEYNVLATLCKMGLNGLKEGDRRGWSASRFYSSEYIMVDMDHAVGEDGGSPISYKNVDQLVDVCNEAAMNSRWFLIQTSSNGLHFIIKTDIIKNHAAYDYAKDGYETFAKRAQSIFREKLGITCELDLGMFRPDAKTRLPGAKNSKDNFEVKHVANGGDDSFKKEVTTFVFGHAIPIQYDEIKDEIKAERAKKTNSTQNRTHNTDNNRQSWYNVSDLIRHMGWEAKEISNGIHVLTGECPYCRGARTAWVDPAGNLHCFRRNCQANPHMKPYEYDPENHAKFMFGAGSMTCHRPNTPIKQGSIETVRTAMREAIRDEIRNPLRYKSVTALAYAMGMGKTTMGAQEAVAAIEDRVHNIIYYLTPTHELAKEVVGHVTGTTDIEVIHAFGRTAEMNSCAMKDEVLRYASVGVNIEKTLCKPTCAEYKCPYYQMKESLAHAKRALIVMTVDQYHWFRNTEKINDNIVIMPKADLIIADECPSHSFTLARKIRLKDINKKGITGRRHWFCDSIRRVICHWTASTRKRGSRKMPLRETRLWSNRTQILARGKDLQKIWSGHFGSQQEYESVVDYIANLTTQPGSDPSDPTIGALPQFVIDIAKKLRDEPRTLAAGNGSIRIFQQITLTDAPILILDANATANLGAWSRCTKKPISVKELVPIMPATTTLLHEKVKASRKEMKNPNSQAMRTLTSIVSAINNGLLNASTKGTVIYTHKSDVETIQAVLHKQVPEQYHDKLFVDYFNRTQGTNRWEGYNVIIAGEAYVNEKSLEETIYASSTQRIAANRMNDEPRNLRVRTIRECIGRSRPYTTPHPVVIAVIGRDNPHKHNYLPHMTWTNLASVLEDIVTLRAAMSRVHYTSTRKPSAETCVKRTINEMSAYATECDISVRGKKNKLLFTVADAASISIHVKAITNSRTLKDMNHNFFFHPELTDYIARVPGMPVCVSGEVVDKDAYLKPEKPPEDKDDDTTPKRKLSRKQKKAFNKRLKQAKTERKLDWLTDEFGGEGKPIELPSYVDRVVVFAVSLMRYLRETNGGFMLKDGQYTIFRETDYIPPMFETKVGEFMLKFCLDVLATQQVPVHMQEWLFDRVDSRHLNLLAEEMGNFYCDDKKARTAALAIVMATLRYRKTFAKLERKYKHESVPKPSFLKSGMQAFRDLQLQMKQAQMWQQQKIDDWRCGHNFAYGR